MEPTAADPVADPEDDPDADPVSADATGATIVVNGIAIAQAIKVFAAAFFTSRLSPKSIQGPRTVRTYVLTRPIVPHSTREFLLRACPKNF